MRDEIHGAVRLDAEIDAGMQSRGVGFRVQDRSRRRLREEFRRHEARGDDERAGREEAAEKLPAIERDVVDTHHARSFAAVLMAARMR